MRRRSDKLDEGKVMSQSVGFSNVAGGLVADVAVDIKEYDTLP